MGTRSSTANGAQWIQNKIKKLKRHIKRKNKELMKLRSRLSCMQRGAENGKSNL